MPTLEGMTASKLTTVLLSVLGSLLTLVGLVVGLVPHSVYTVDCGSGFSPNPYIYWTTECVTETDSARSLALALLIPGLAALVVFGFLALYRWQTARDAREAATVQPV